MGRTARLALLLLLVPAVAWAGPPTPNIGPGLAPRKTPLFIDGVKDTGQFLPDTAVLARVGPRVTRVRDFVRSWFNAYAPDRPKPDSAGRAEFLLNMVNKDLMALEALKIAKPLDFEDRLVLRETQQRVLSNVLFQRAVVESTVVTEDDVRRGFEQFKEDVHPRHILLRDPETANRVRGDLLAKRLTWDEAVKRFSLDDSTKAKGGDLGWSRRQDVDAVMGECVWPLKTGELSEPFRDDDGYHIAQITERRPNTKVPDYGAIRTYIYGQIMQYRVSLRSEVLTQQLRNRTGMVYDTANVVWAADQFAPTLAYDQGAKGAEITVNEVLPTFGSADTARVLARWNGGKYTVGSFVYDYSQLPPMARPNVNRFETLRRAIDGYVLEPYMAQEALNRGLDKDPLAVWQIDRKREELLVQKMYQDSVASRTYVEPKERRDFYEKHLAQYFTYPSVDFAIFACLKRPAADSLAAKLRAGLDANAALKDSVRYGWATGSIQHTNQSEHGPWQKLLFESLRPHEVAIDGPGKDGSWFVIQMLNYDGGRQLSFDEAQGMVDESVQNIKSEEKLKVLISHLKKKYHWSAHPELVERIRLVEM